MKYLINKYKQMTEPVQLDGHLFEWYFHGHLISQLDEQLISRLHIKLRGPLWPLCGQMNIKIKTSSNI